MTTYATRVLGQFTEEEGKEDGYNRVYSFVNDAGYFETYVRFNIGTPILATYEAWKLQHSGV